jgi:hypothetical protein
MHNWGRNIGDDLWRSWSRLRLWHWNCNWRWSRSRSRRLMLNNSWNLSCSLLNNSTLLMNVDNR